MAGCSGSRRSVRVRSTIQRRIQCERFLTVLGALLIVGSTVQIAAAAERHALKSDRGRVHATEQFRKANDFLISPFEQHDLSDYSEGHVISAPAGQ